MKRFSTTAMVIIAALVINIFLCTNSAQAWFSDPNEPDWPEPGWPEIFEPNQLRTLNLEMDPDDWQAVINNHPAEDGCLYEEVELPAMFWMEGEEGLKIKVAVRRKKAIAFPDENNSEKVALKIDINEYFDEDPCAVSYWHGLKKLSLEANSDAIDVIAEGVACNLHRIASLTEGYGWPVWYANWVKVYVNGTYIGLYVNNEQYDKQYLRNRDLYVSHDSWLYKFMDCFTRFELKIGDDTFPKSPALDALCYAPFAHPDDPDLMPAGGICPVPDDANVFADMNQWINMARMLSSAAIDAIIANSDPLFWQSNNTYFMDWNLGDPCETRKRMYFPWDVDSSFKSYDTTIYYEGSSSAYDDLILTNPVFRGQYNQIMRDLLDGPLTFADINDFLDMVEPVITAAAEADPMLMGHINDRIGATTAAEVFDWLRDWFAERIPNVLAQVEFDDPTPPPGIILLQDGFEGAVWDANWTGTWVEDTSTYCRGASSAHADKTNSGDFACTVLDTSDATTVHVDFWLQKNNISSYTAKFYYYNGTTYDEVNDIDALGADDEWLHYTDTITDSNYFIPDFRIQFSATLGGGGAGRDVWVDDVVITKELPSPCVAANLDEIGLVDFKDYAMLGNDWMLTGPDLPGDIDANDIVNIDDLDWMLGYWLNDCN
ncbi:CotH kinase family protein [Planctomycetota bacterium]